MAASRTPPLSSLLAHSAISVSPRRVRYDDGVDDRSIFVLTGGRSSRMATDKAMLPIGGVSLLQLPLDKARQVAPQTLIVGSRKRYARYGNVIEDIIPGCGP